SRETKVGMARCAVTAAFSGGTLRSKGQESIARRSVSSAPAQRGDAAARHPYRASVLKYPSWQQWLVPKSMQQRSQLPLKKDHTPWVFLRRSPSTQLAPYKSVVARLQSRPSEPLAHRRQGKLTGRSN